MTRGSRAFGASGGSTSSSRRGRITAAVGVAGLLAALAPWGVTAAGAWPSAGDPEAAVTGGPQVEPQVVLVQRVEPEVTIESLTGGRLSATGADLVAISTTGSNDVPDVAMRAYRSAARQMQTIRPQCQIPWTLLAGIGRVESDHGRYGGSELGVDGLPRPAIRGVALNGVGPVAAIADSDNGRWDDDKVWDRAVGPMQFIPTTWQSAGRDGDGDGVADPNDIDDAALAAADYLCPAEGSILSDAALDAAIFSYNHSDYYVALVRAFMTGYETGVFELPSPPPVEEEDKDKKKGKDDESQEKAAEQPEPSTEPSRSPRRTASPKPPTKSEPRPQRPRRTRTPAPSTSPSPTVTPTTTPTASASSGVQSVAPSGG